MWDAINFTKYFKGGLINPRTDKFEFTCNPYNIWYNSMGDVIEHISI
jgi:hypothetical protein